MSFQINWLLLANDAELNENVRLFIDKELNSLLLPSFIDKLAVTRFSLGETAPEITIRYIGDPFDDFYADHDTDDEARRYTSPQSPSSLTSDSSDDSDSDEDATIVQPPTTVDLALDAAQSDPDRDPRKGTDFLRPFSNYNMNNLGLGPPELDPPASIFPHSAYRLQGSGRAKDSERSPYDIQFILEVEFQSKIAIDLSINLLVNYPLTHFISLPITLHVTDLAIHSLAAVAYLEKKVFISILCDLNDSAADYFTTAKGPLHEATAALKSPAGGNFVDYSAAGTRERIDVIRNINIDTEIGEVENNVLRNVGKVEKFLVEQLRNIIRDEICWPGWLAFDLSEPDES